MSSDVPPSPNIADDEVSTLIATLHRTEQRLDELLGGEVDTVADHNGNPFLLRRAQEQLRNSDLGRQAAILNALPAHIALLDNRGLITAVNQAWRQFAITNVLHSPGHGVGLNYLEICDRAEGKDSAEARQVAAGIRAVLGGGERSFSIEYPCHSAAKQRWFLLVVTPLSDDQPDGVVVMHLNITGRRRAELTALRLAAIVESSSDAIISKDLNSIVASWNKSAETIFGYAAEEMVGTSILRLMPVGHPDDHHQIIARLRRGEQVGHFDTRRQTKAGRVIDVSVTASAVKGATGELIGVSITARDITERKRAEETLRESEERFAGAFEHAPIGMALVSPTGRWLKVNPAVCKLLGYSADELLGGNFQDITHPEDVALSLENVRRAMANEFRSCQIEKRYLHKDGHIVMGALSISLIRDGEGQPLYFVSQIQDITARKAAAEALRTSEERLRAALSASGTGTFRWNIRTNELDWDDSLNVLFGLASGTVRSLETFIGTVHPDDRPGVIERCERCARDGADFAMEFRVLWPDGSLHWLDDRGKTISDAAGKPLYMTGACVDITERKRAELALRVSEAEFRSLAEAVPQMVWITRADGWNLYFSQQWMDYTGLTLEESLGYGWIKPFHPEDQQQASDAWQHATATATIYSIESRLRRADGVYRWWLMRGVPQLDATGNILKWFGTCTDIDDLKLAQARIGEQAALLDIAHEAIQVKDLEGRIIYWNKGAEGVFGWTAAEAVGRKATELFQQDHRAFPDALAILLKNGEWQGEVLKRNKKNELLTIESSWTLVCDADGSPKSILAINSDITEKKKLESQFLRAQRMEGIGTLAGGIAHDLNNVLAPILMAVELLRKDEANAEDHALLDTLRASAQHGADLVKQVLSFARGVEGRRVLVNLVHLLREIQKIIRDTFPKNIDFKFSSARQLWTMTGDPTQLHQVFMNLCVNARDAMPDGGRLNLSIENSLVDDTYAGMNPECAPGPYILVKVTDTGSGIPQGVRDKIFEPFFTTKEIGKGTGLGLSTTLTIIKSHGGFINLYSEMGKGTTFNVYLPANNTLESAEDQAVEQTNLPRGNGELLLVVDDEEAIRKVAQKMLERFGYRVLLAIHGAQAVSLYAQHRDEIALVITDMAMPVMDGPATIIALKSINPAVIVIGSSGFASSGGVAKALGAGVQHFVPKPYTAETMLKVLKAALHPA